MNVNWVTELLNLWTFVTGVIVLVSIIAYQTRYKKVFQDVYTKYYFQLGFFVSTLATLGSLYYSEVLAYAPCVLCWYQRIFMYPISILFIIAAVKRSAVYVRLNSMVLAAVGAVFSLYHYFIQMQDTGSVACSTVGYTVSCSEYFSVSYGYVTIPMMAFTAFIVIILLGWINKD